MVDINNPGMSVAVTSTVGVYQAGTIAAGGTAQNLFSGAMPGDGFEIINTSASEILYFSESATATVAGAASPPIQPGGSYTTPRGYKPTGAISIIAATTGHPFVARAF